MINSGKEWDWMDNKNNRVMDKWVIFDLDGTLALIDERRKLAEKENGKMDWDKFFDPKNIKLDKPNWPIINTLKAFRQIISPYKIAIFSGRNDISIKETKEWLREHGINWDILKMRPNKHPFKFMDDRKLKLQWLNEVDWKEDVEMVFDDRQKVVDMWREVGLTCLQVAPGEWPAKNVL
jgi:FMN phosphatase YigB (HAD superfamily)